MRQDVSLPNSGIEPRTGTFRRRARWFFPVAVFFAIAFTIDMLTDQQYSSVWGSAAIIGSVVYVFPTIRPTLAAFGGYAAIWEGFNLVRAITDEAGFAIVDTEVVSRWERSVFGGSLPSAQLQAAFFDSGKVQAQDVILSLVHGSFFVVPFVVAAIVWWRTRGLFLPFAIASTLTFALGLLGFLLLPTAPPWMSDPGDVIRITPHVLGDTIGVSFSQGSGGDLSEGFRFEPNHLAAMASVHVSATVLVFLLATRIGTITGVFGGIYALLMTLGVVYLGEHFVLDAVLGWITAMVGWKLAFSWCNGKMLSTQRIPVVR